MHSIRIRGLGAVLLFVVAWSPFALSSERLPDGFRGKCAPLASAALNRWGSKGDWQRELPGAGEISSHRSPSKEVGVWLALSKSEAGVIRAVRDSLNLRTIIEWAETDCVPRMAAKPIRYRIPAAEFQKSFTDERLKALLIRSRAGLIYAWSPQMPLSADGFLEVQKAARKMGLPLTLLLDPQADPTAAERFAKVNKLPAQAIRRLQSLELLNRGMSEHYPSLVVFQNGEIVGRAFPGHKDADRYLAFVSARLKPNSRGDRKGSGQ